MALAADPQLTTQDELHVLRDGGPVLVDLSRQLDAFLHSPAFNSSRVCACVRVCVCRYERPTETRCV
jgi:hypothetical protein